jgi:2-dehydro-3-deoxyphosphooctonate aldolase (KDO 8-P synthase)
MTVAKNNATVTDRHYSQSQVKPQPIKIGKVTIGGTRPVFILGPCVIESEKFVWRMAKQIHAICKKEKADLIFKASYDKANRTSIRSFRGIDAKAGCEILEAIGQELGMPVTTDVHSMRKSPVRGSISSRSRLFSVDKPTS